MPFKRTTSFPPEKDPFLLFVGDVGREWTLDELADYLQGQTGCSRRNLGARCAQEGWIEARRQERIRRAKETKNRAAASLREEIAAQRQDDFPQTVLDRVAEKVATQLAPKVAEVDARHQEVREMLLQSAQLAAADGLAVLVSKRIKVTVDPDSGEPLADLGDAPVGDVIRKTELRERSAAMRLVEQGANIWEKVLDNDPERRFALQTAQIESVKAQIALLQARLKGSLPPDEVVIVDPSDEKVKETVRREFGIESGERFSVMAIAKKYLEQRKKDIADGGSGDADNDGEPKN